MSKLYVGCLHNGKREVFRCAFIPTEQTHGESYFAVIGPFHTKRGAIFMSNSHNNPHCQTVSDAERLAKL